MFEEILSHLVKIEVAVTEVSSAGACEFPATFVVGEPRPSVAARGREALAYIIAAARGILIARSCRVVSAAAASLAALIARALIALTIAAAGSGTRISCAAVSTCLITLAVAVWIWI